MSGDQRRAAGSPGGNVGWVLPGDLRADCESCAGLCCVLHGFYRSADFPIDKPPGTACPHLGSSFRCTVHDELRQRGFNGCVAYECYGAGQRVVAAWDDALPAAWWSDADTVEELQRCLEVLRPLQEMQAMLYAAEQLPVDAGLKQAVRTLRRELRALAEGARSE